MPSDDEAPRSLEDHHSGEFEFADAMARYNRSCDEMRTVRLNPRKVVPFDQYPEETQQRGSAIVRIRNTKKYVSYLLRTAAENEHFAGQARRWWAWWDKTQVEPSKAGPAPLVSPSIEAALRVAAGRRRRETSGATRETKGSATVETNHGNRDADRFHKASRDSVPCDGVGAPAEFRPNVQQRLAMRIMSENPGVLYSPTALNRALKGRSFGVKRAGYSTAEGVRKNVLQPLRRAGLVEYVANLDGMCGWRLAT